MQRGTQRGIKRIAAVAASALALSVLTAGAVDATSRHSDDGRSGRCDVGRRSRAVQVFVLKADGTTLACADARRPRALTVVGRVSGLAGDTRLVGIDFRPATGALVGLGDQGGVYTVDPVTAVASNRQQLSVALAGTSFGVDFNPTVDRLRIVSDTGQNLRVNVDTGAATVDTALSSPGIVGAAYTNNDADPGTATTLYDIDATTDQVTIQAPPNNGTLNPVGRLGVDTSDVVGFDIRSELEDGSTQDVRAFASLTVDGRSGLYEVNLFTGRATHLGWFPVAVADIAVALDRG